MLCSSELLQWLTPRPVTASSVVTASHVLRAHHAAPVGTLPPVVWFYTDIHPIEYGECGRGAYCLGGCDPLSSHSLDSCVPAPQCNSKDYQLNSLDGITSNTEYLGDASSSNWVYSGTPKIYNDQVLLTLSEDGASASGTLLASTSYVWYGKVTANLTSSRGAGIVSAFILLSDVKDEIDFEFIGADLTNVQSNFYYQGITECMWVHPIC